MDIFTLLHRGDYHPVYCEDSLFTEDIEAGFFFAAVMDGCSNGKESHFASALMGKLLHKIIKGFPHTISITPQSSAAVVSRIILKQLFEELKNAKSQLSLECSELLSTLILLVYNKEQKEAFIISLGDGMIAIDGRLHVIDQQNMPDYISYHLAKNFKEWFKGQKHTFHVTNPYAIAISTDGIESFMTKNHELAPVDVPNYFLNDVMFAQHKNMLGKKIQVLYAEHGISPKDDLGIVRLIF